MTIIFKGQDFKYEVENVCKLFFPLTHFQFRYDGEKDAELPEGDFLLTRLKKGKKTTFLLAVFYWQGRCYLGRRKLSNNTVPYQKEAERILSIAVFDALKKATGIEVKWGVMTGIRPVKQMHYWLAQGNTPEQVRAIFQNDFLVAPQKIELCEKTLKNQREIIAASGKNSYSLYVSIPFCPTRCSYCSFVSSSINTPKARALLKEYVPKLCEELKVLAQIARERNLKLETVYIGGGTPTTLSAQQLELLTDCIATEFPMDEVREYTVEAGRADTITEEKLRVLRKAGVERISINPQSFNDRVLQAIGRKHTAQDVIDCYHMAQKIGFDAINMDLIAGLPEDDLSSFQRTLETAAKLSPENITVHTLTIKRSSDLFRTGDRKTVEEQVPDMVGYAGEKLSQWGYEPYYLYRQKNTLQNLENVGYAKAGKECWYNVYIMEEIHTILAAGAGGVSKLIHPASPKVNRIFNFKYPFEYLSGFEEILKRKEEIGSFYQAYQN